MCRGCHLFIALIWMLASSVVATNGLAQDSNPTAEDLKQIRLEMQREERRLDTVKKRAEEFRKAEQQLSKQLDEAVAKKEETRRSLEDLKREAERIEGAVTDVRASIEARRGIFQRRLVAVYKATRSTSSIGYLFAASTPNDFVKRVRYLSSVARFDSEYARVLEKLANSMVRDQARMKQLAEEKKQGLEKLTKLEAELAERREKKSDLLKEQQSQVTLQEKVIAKLRVSAARLEQVLANIMGGERIEAPPPVPPESEEPTEIPETPPPAEVVTTQPDRSAPGIIMTPYSGTGLEKLRGRLLFPVAASQTVQRFGKQRHDEFSDVVVMKGVEVRAPVGAKVTSVADGKVVLSQVLPGYGNVIIVDHGQRYYTLYGRLASSLRSLGDSVKAGEALAVLGELDYKGRNFYFEIRNKGKAVDPGDYFKNLPEAAAG